MGIATEMDNFTTSLCEHLCGDLKTLFSFDRYFQLYIFLSLGESCWSNAKGTNAVDTKSVLLVLIK